LLAEETVRACLAAWAERDIDKTVSFFAEDMRFSLHVEEGHLDLAGTAVGRALVRERLQHLLNTFDFLAYVVDSAKADGPLVRTAILYFYRHKASGLMIDGRYRHVWRVENGVIQSCDEYHDAAALKAFLELAAQSS
jgi:ketosteroid isomerase-like protein